MKVNETSRTILDPYPFSQQNRFVDIIKGVWLWRQWAIPLFNRQLFSWMSQFFFYFCMGCWNDLSYQFSIRFLFNVNQAIRNTWKNGEYRVKRKGGGQPNRKNPAHQVLFRPKYRTARSLSLHSEAKEEITVQFQIKKKNTLKRILCTVILKCSSALTMPPRREK